jgi:hypothetical protein
MPPASSGSWPGVVRPGWPSRRSDQPARVTAGSRTSRRNCAVAAGGSWVPHWTHRNASGAAHSTQNFAWGGFSCWLFFAKTIRRTNWLIRYVQSGHYFGLMITLLLHLLRLFPVLFGGHRQLALENLALRQQLAIYKRTIIRPPLRPADRLFWIGLARIWTGWRQALVIVTPATVLQWQRRRFREYWTKLSGRPSGGRPQVHPEIKTLIIRMAAANPL